MIALGIIISKIKTVLGIRMIFCLKTRLKIGDELYIIPETMALTDIISHSDCFFCSCPV